MVVDSQGPQHYIFWCSTNKTIAQGLSDNSMLAPHGQLNLHNSHFTHQRAPPFLQSAASTKHRVSGVNKLHLGQVEKGSIPCDWPRRKDCMQAHCTKSMVLNKHQRGVAGHAQHDAHPTTGR